mgnify:CR=1 FL=1
MPSDGPPSPSAQPISRAIAGGVVELAEEPSPVGLVDVVAVGALGGGGDDGDGGVLAGVRGRSLERDVTRLGEGHLEHQRAAVVGDAAHDVQATGRAGDVHGVGPLGLTDDGIVV